MKAKRVKEYIKELDDRRLKGRRRYANDVSANSDKELKYLDKPVKSGGQVVCSRSLVCRVSGAADADAAGAGNIHTITIHPQLPPQTSSLVWQSGVQI